MDIVLALGGGGVRGYAHLGVIHVLQQTGFRIRAIAGSSAGAVIGSLVAAGHDILHIQNEFDEIDRSHLFNRHLDNPPSLLGLSGFERFLRRLLADREFSDLEIPLVMNAVDIHSGRLHYLDQGDVVSSVMASIAVPGFFPPREIDGILLVDGSVMEPVPVLPARKLAPGIPVVAVALSPTLESLGEINKRSSLIGALPVLDRFLTRSRVAQSIHTFLMAVDIGSIVITELTLERDRPEVLIRPRVCDIGLLDQVKGDNLVTAGENATFEQLEKIRRAVSWRGKLDKLIPG